MNKAKAIIAIIITITSITMAIATTIMAYNTRTIECGMCGAHVHDWWVVRNDDNTGFVDVCSKCYDIVADN